jgi:uncharacterized protein (DUF58 family)
MFNRRLSRLVKTPTASSPRWRPDEVLRIRRPWCLLAFTLFVLSAFIRQPIVLLFALCTLVISLVPEIWYRLALRQLVVSQYVDRSHISFGETVVLSIAVENQKFLPLPWLEVNDEIPSELTPLKANVEPTHRVNRNVLVNAFSLWSFQRVTRRYSLQATSRGIYTFGPATVRTCDPFGWLMREQRMNVPAIVQVYPLLAPVEAFGLVPRHPFGERAMPRRLFEDPLRMVGVRDYQIGDDPRRIHWKATARAGELRSKVYEASSQHNLLLFLEINTYKESWMGVDPVIQELTIAASASLCNWGLDEGYSVGLFANSIALNGSGNISTASTSSPPNEPARTLPTIRVPLARDDAQLERILSSLARLVPYFGSPMHKLIESEYAAASAGAIVILVSPSQVLSEETLESLLALRARGAEVHLALTGDSADDPPVETYDLPLHYLGGKEKWHELIAATNANDDLPGERNTATIRLD